jgi:tetratricopeptide (TPR) repeat protein
MTQQPPLDLMNAVTCLARAKHYVQREEYDKALVDLNEVLRVNPDATEALMLRAAVLVRREDYEPALADVERRMQLEPPDPAVLVVRANLRAHRGDFTAALADFTEFLRREPGTTIALRGRSLSYARLHRFDEALADLDEALRLEPDNASAYLERGRAHQDNGGYAAAVADYEKALALQPDDASIHNQYAWMLAACPRAEYRNGPRSVELATRACALTDWKEANLLDTLAAAYAECGRFDEAVAWATKALAMADVKLQEAIRGHLAAFQSGQPARSEEVVKN